METIFITGAVLFRLIITIIGLPVFIGILLFRHLKGKSNKWFVSWILAVDNY